MNSVCSFGKLCSFLKDYRLQAFCTLRSDKSDPESNTVFLVFA